MNNYSQEDEDKIFKFYINHKDFVILQYDKATSKQKDISMVDGNLAALDRYEQEQAEAERKEAAFIDAVDNSIAIELDDLYNRFNVLKKEYCVEYEFENYVIEVL